MPVSRADRAARLAQIRSLRAAGKTGFSTYEVEEAESIYETVDDDQYKKVVRKRLDEDDFVVDDNGEGYADDGREDWQDQKVVYEDDESDEDLPKQSKAGEYSLMVGRRLDASDGIYSEAKARRRRRTTGKAEQRHQQVLQRQPSCCSAEAEAGAHCRRR